MWGFLYRGLGFIVVNWHMMGYTMRCHNVIIMVRMLIWFWGSRCWVWAMIWGLVSFFRAGMGRDSGLNGNGRRLVGLFWLFVSIFRRADIFGAGTCGRVPIRYWLSCSI